MHLSVDVGYAISCSGARTENANTTSGLGSTVQATKDCPPVRAAATVTNGSTPYYTDWPLRSQSLLQSLSRQQSEPL